MKIRQYTSFMSAYSGEEMDLIGQLMGSLFPFMLLFFEQNYFILSKLKLR